MAAANPQTSQMFIELLEKSRLVDSARLRAVLAQIIDEGKLPPDSATLSQMLIREKLITHFQAEQLLQGRHKGFFLGKYCILELIGTGGMGRVYLAEHLIMRRRVAIKVLPKAKSSNPAALARFKREARAIASLSHPNMVEAYDFDHEGELYFFVMEYVDGLSVLEIVREFGAINWANACDYVCQTARALEHAHVAGGLVHRDVKPGNIMVDSSGNVKLLDLGLAVFYEERNIDPVTLVYDENILGTADYLAPEQAIDSHNVDIRADIYSLGGSFYYMLTGSPPFPDGTITQKLLWHQHKDPRAVRELCPEVPVEVSLVLQKMMSKHKEDRYSTPIEIAAALKPYAKRNDLPLDLPAIREYRQVRIAALQRDSGAAGTARPPKRNAENMPTKSGAFSRFGASSKELDEEDTVIPMDNQPLSTPSQPATATAETSSNDADGSGDFSATLETITGDSTNRFSRSVRPAPRQDSAPHEERKTNYLIGGAVSVGIVVLLAVAYFLNWFGSTPVKAKEPIPSAKSAPVDPPPEESKRIEVVQGGGVALMEALTNAMPGETVSVKTLNEEPWQISPLKIGTRPDDTGYSIDPKESLGLVGQGRNTVLSIGPSFDGPLFSIAGAAKFSIKDLTLDGGGKPGPLIEIVGPNIQGFTLERVFIRNVLGDAIRILGADGTKENPVTIRNVAIESTDPAGHGIAITDTDGTRSRCTDVRIQNCRVIGPCEAGIFVNANVRDFSVRESIFSGGTTGLLFRGGTKWELVKIDACTFHGMTGALTIATKPEPGSHWRISDCLFSQLASSPIRIPETAAGMEGTTILQEHNWDTAPLQQSTMPPFSGVAHVGGRGPVTFVNVDPKKAQFLLPSSNPDFKNPIGAVPARRQSN